MIGDSGFYVLIVTIAHLVTSVVSVGISARNIDRHILSGLHALRALVAQIALPVMMSVAGYLLFRFGSNLAGIVGVFFMALGIRMSIAQIVEGIAMPNAVAESPLYQGPTRGS